MTRALTLLLAALAAELLLPEALWAHDCSSLYDCLETAGFNGTVSVIGGAIGVVSGVVGTLLGGSAAGAAGGAAGHTGASPWGGGGSGPGDAGEDAPPAVPGAPAGGPGLTTPGSGAGASPGGVSGSGPTAPPSYPHERVVSGNAAANLLEEAGIARLVRDANGNVIKVEEAFPGAFMTLSGGPVTIRTGETSGGAPTDPQWAEEAEGKIAGLGIKPGQSGAPDEVVVVVKHGDPSWQTLPADPVAGLGQAFDSARKAVEEGIAKVGRAAEGARDQVGDWRSRLGEAEVARSMYKAAKTFGAEAEAKQAVEELARKIGVDPRKAREIMEMPDDAWEKGYKRPLEELHKLMGGEP